MPRHSKIPDPLALLRERAMQAASSDHPIYEAIALIGLSGVGKSTVGKVLADRLDWDFFDTDELAARTDGRNIRRLFEEAGERYFRELEHGSVYAALVYTPCVVATGGGAVLAEENRILIRERSFAVWLDAPTDVLVARLPNNDPDNRPLLSVADPRARLEEFRRQRERYYAELSQLRIETTNRTPDEICDEILNVVQDSLTTRPRRYPDPWF